jgi:hypothetical protein
MTTCDYLDVAPIGARDPPPGGVSAPVATDSIGYAHPRKRRCLSLFRGHDDNGPTPEEVGPSYTA